MEKEVATLAGKRTSCLERRERELADLRCSAKRRWMRQLQSLTKESNMEEFETWCRYHDGHIETNELCHLWRPCVSPWVVYEKRLEKRLCSSTSDDKGVQYSSDRYMNTSTHGTTPIVATFVSISICRRQKQQYSRWWCCKFCMVILGSLGIKMIFSVRYFLWCNYYFIISTFYRIFRNISLYRIFRNISIFMQNFSSIKGGFFGSFFVSMGF